MHKRQLGTTGIEVSEIGFGAWGIGGVAYRGGVPRGWIGVDAGQSLESIRRAWELGITFYDTADVYGAGKSEVLLGLGLGANKKDAIIASKCGHGMVEEEVRTTPSYIMGALDASLTRLERDWIDVYMIHSPPLSYLTDEAFSTMDRLRQSGKIRCWGASVHKPEDAMRVLDGGGQVVEVVYNMLSGELFPGLFELAQARGAGLVAREVLASGLLNGKLTKDTAFPPEDHRSGKFSPDRIREIAGKLETIDWLDAEGVSMPQAALRYALSEPAISSVIVGCRTAGHVERNCLESGKRLSPERLAQIRSLQG